MSNCSKMLFLFFIFLFQSQLTAKTEKKVVIQLYEDGTWEKVAAESATQAKPSIEDTWIKFQEAIKSGDKNRVVEFFDLPCELDVCGGDQSKQYYPLKGNLSKRKLLDSFKKLFDKSFTDRIIKLSSDEYGKYEGGNVCVFNIDFAKDGDVDLVYGIQFYLVQNAYKIGKITMIGYAK